MLTKIGAVKKTKKCLYFYSDHLHIRIALGQYGWLEAIRIWRWLKKKLKALFGFFDGENLDFGSIWATQNHLLQQGKFWLCAIISLFLHDFATYSTDKPNFDQRLKFLHQMRVFIKVCLWDSNDHYSWHLVIQSVVAI